MYRILDIPNIHDFYVAIRVKHWVKNLIIPVVGLSVLNVESGMVSLESVLFAFIAFCIASSSIYVLNDLLDVENDRKHPKKRLRPIASGKISERFAQYFVLIAIPLSVLLAHSSSLYVLVLLVLYLIINVGYSYKLKNIPQVDIICVASGFVIRALAGALSVGNDINFWILGAITFSCMALVIMKRMKEVKQLGSSGETRSTLSSYSYKSLQRLHDMFLVMTILSVTMFVGNSDINHPLFKGFSLLLIASLFLVFVQKINENEDGDPTEFFYKHKYLSITSLIIVFTVFIGSTYLETAGMAL